MMSRLFYTTSIYMGLAIGMASCYHQEYSNSNDWSAYNDTENNIDGLVHVVSSYENRSNQIENLKYEVSPHPAEKKVSEKIIYSARIGLTVKNLDSTIDSIKHIAKSHHGYVSETGTYRSVIRVKSDELEAALNAISSLGKVDYKHSSGKDVTNDYHDYQIRLENAEKARLRYLDLLEQAENVQAALLVEKELERLNETIDMLKGKMNRINHLSNYSTITIILKEQVKPGILGYVGIGVYRSVKWLFVRN